MNIIYLIYRIIISSFIIISIISYNPYDQSLNTLSDNLDNLGGSFGAIISDLILQYYGLLGLCIPIIIIIKPKILETSMLLILMLPITMAIQLYIEIPMYYNSGGVIGYKLNEIISDYIDLSDYIAPISFSISAMILLIMSTLRNTKTHIETNKAKKTKNKKAANVIITNTNNKLPDVKFLSMPEISNIKQESHNKSASILEQVLQDFGVNGKVVRISCGPVVTLYELKPSAGTKTSRVIGLSSDIARSMSAISARIAVVPGRDGIGIELPNNERQVVFLRTLIESPEYRNEKLKLPIALGKNINGEPVIADLSKMPHLLVAGTTGSGKSVGINAMILSLVYRLSPSECKFIMIDPKMLELSVYNDIPHLLSPVVTEPKEAVAALKWVVKEMENRYRLMSNLSVRNIEGYNSKIKSAINSGKILKKTVQTGFNKETGRPEFEFVELDMQVMPFIVVIIDEMADLMLVAGKEIEASVQRLAQMARAAGIHIITATQRPSVDVITGVIKANFPTRISFAVTSKIDSRTILGEQGAEQLLGMGDMLFMSAGSHTQRVHGPFVSDEEVQSVSKFLKEQEDPEYKHEITTISEDADEKIDFNPYSDNSMYEQAVRIVLQDRKASISYIQRKLRIGYNRAASLVEQMEEAGIVSQQGHNGKREILIDK